MSILFNPMHIWPYFLVPFFHFLMYCKCLSLYIPLYCFYSKWKWFELNCIEKLCICIHEFIKRWVYDMYLSISLSGYEVIRKWFILWYSYWKLANSSFTSHACDNLSYFMMIVPYFFRRETVIVDRIIKPLECWNKTIIHYYISPYFC